MGHNPSRYSLKRLELRDKLMVDDYKARSIWGRWWQLDGDFRARFFNQDELRWVKRYGSRCDQLASLTVAPRTEKERHFVEVSSGRAMPETDRERLWLRVQMACRYQEALVKAALCDQAMEVASGLDAEVRSLREDVRLMEADAVNEYSTQREQLADWRAMAQRRGRLLGLGNAVRAVLPPAPTARAGCFAFRPDMTLVQRLS